MSEYTVQGMKDVAFFPDSYNKKSIADALLQLLEYCDFDESFNTKIVGKDMTDKTKCSTCGIELRTCDPRAVTPHGTIYCVSCSGVKQRSEVKSEVKTLRDEFAMAALTGWLSSDPSIAAEAEWGVSTVYAIADEMMKAREDE